MGRAAAALAADPNVGTKNGDLFSTWALSKEYGLTDVDGGRPWGRKVQEIVHGDEPAEMNLFTSAPLYRSSMKNGWLARTDQGLRRPRMTFILSDGMTLRRLLSSVAAGV